MNLILVLAFSTCAFGRTLSKDKIVGGTVASEGQFPYQISQRYNSRHRCGGSIIDEHTILSAAHCVHGISGDKFKIVVGSNQLSSGGLWYSVSRYVMHEQYDSNLLTDDIAVIKVLDPIQFTTHIQPVVVDDTFISADVECVLSGFGTTSYPGNASNDLLYFEGNVFDFNKCKEVFAEDNFPVLESNICAFSKNGIGACSGDSGGPLVSNQKQIGIASWVDPCGVGDPDVFTRVSYYYDWITTQQLKTY
ncbi:hypothetical protein RN001_015196 [Aquatica leii]|uniref:Peptidase S1 domain-containing protein n=1 Tax=Aquatica leii TaxID=1421715 RepID=A0AAN7SBY3_9COLE|nr:hypothetical protein RN001_015196 [Aquatica leii]